MEVEEEKNTCIRRASHELDISMAADRKLQEKKKKNRLEEKNRGAGERGNVRSWIAGSWDQMREEEEGDRREGFEGRTTFGVAGSAMAVHAMESKAWTPWPWPVNLIIIIIRCL